MQRSDVTLSPRTCGKCGSTVLQHSVPGATEAMLAEPTAFLKHVLHGR